MFRKIAAGLALLSLTFNSQALAQSSVTHKSPETFNQKTTHKAGIDVTGAFNDTGNGVFTGTLNVSGASTFAAFSALATTLSSLGVTNNATVGGTFSVTGNSSFSTLSSSGLASLNSLSVANGETIGGTLGVTGASNFGLLTTSNLATLYSLGVTNNANINGNLTVTGTTSLAALNSSGTASVTGLAVTSNATIGGTLAVTSGTNLSGLTTTGLATLNSLSVTNNATVGGTLGITGNTTASNLTTSGALTTNGSFVLGQQTDSATSGADQVLTILKPTIILTNAALTSIGGISGPASGMTEVAINKTGASVSIINEDTSVTAANRILTGSGSNLSLANDATIILTYNNTDSRWHVTGGSSGGGGTGTGETNFISNPTGASGTGGYATYLNTAQATPVTGTGGSPTVTISSSTTSPLSGSTSLILTKPASNVQGQGWSYDFTIDSAYKSKVLQIVFDYMVNSGTFTAGSSSTDSDVEVYVYDKDAGQIIQPSTYKLYSSSATVPSEFIGNFQTSATSTNYRLIFHVATTSASAYSLKLGGTGIKVTNSKYIYGTPISDWQAYTATISNMGTISAQSLQWRRVGDSIQIRGPFTMGTGSAAQAQISLPNGYVSADTSKIPSIQACGTHFENSGNSTYFGSGAMLCEPSVGYVTFGISSSTGSPLTKQNGNAFGSSLTFSVNALVPIQGLGSTVQMSDSADQRVVSAAYYTTANCTGGTANSVNFDTKLWDSHGAVSASPAGTGTWKFTAPVPGYYSVRGAIAMTVGANMFISLYKNGSAYIGNFGYITSNNGVGTFAGGIQLNAGDYIDIRTGSGTVAGGTLASSTSSNIFIEKVQGPSAIGATETVAAKYKVSTTGTTSATQPINYDTKVFDTHGAVTTGVGTWRFTAPIAGVYNVFGTYCVTGTPGFQLFKNGVLVDNDLVDNTGANNVFTFSTSIQLNAGDYIDLRASGSVTWNGTFNYVNIQKLK